MNITENNIDEQQDRKQQYKSLKEFGNHCVINGDYAHAQECFEEAASMEPDAAEPYVGLGVVALQKDRLDDADIAFRVACRLDVNCAKAYAGLAMVAQQREDYKQAFQMYLKCLELDTDDLVALLGLFQTSRQMGSFERVIHYLEVYLQTHPDDTAVMFSLAALYMKENLPERSRKILLDILNLEPGNKDAADLLEEADHSLAQAKQEAASGKSRNDRLAGAQVG